MQIIDTFSGIGGFSLAGSWLGWKTVQFCEINPFCQHVLKYYWPNVPIHDNIKTLKASDIFNNGLYEKNKTTIFVGGVPCQPWSNAGKRLGKADDRDLWKETINLIAEVQPNYAVLENVHGLINWNGGMVFNEVQTDLEAAGYEVWPYVLPACAVNAPHRRDRVWFVAHSNSGIRGSQKRELFRKQEQRRHMQEIQGAISGRNASNPHSDGQQRINGNDEKQPSEGREHAQHYIEQVITSNTISGSTGSSREGGGIEENGSGNNSQQEKWRTKTELNSGCNDVSRVAANTDNPRNTASRSGTDRDGKEEVGEREQPFIEPSGYFQNFPTQSPICNGNDGLSNRLVGITFPKWRNESIKAMGNSIVPQVVFQIFKAIELYECQQQQS